MTEKLMITLLLLHTGAVLFGGINIGLKMVGRVVKGMRRDGSYGGRVMLSKQQPPER